MKSFRDIIKEKEVISIEEQFEKFCKQLPKEKIEELLAGMNQKGEKISPMMESSETPEGYLRDIGFKIKTENPNQKGKELEFYKKSQAEEAFDELKSIGFDKEYTLDLANNYLSYEAI